MAPQFAENFYSFRVVGLAVDRQSPKQAALAAIEQKLAEAHQAYYLRRFQDAIQAYQDASALVFAQLDPGFTYAVGKVDRSVRFSRDPRLFDALLSVSLEWMNVQPVHQPMAAVRPRVAVDPALFGKDVPQLNRTGVFSGQLASPAALDSVADWQQARTYADQGNDAQVQFFAQRAQKTQPDVFQLLGGTPKADATPAPGPAGGSASGVGEVADSSVAVHLPAPALPTRFFAQDRSLGFIAQDKPVQVSWQAGQAPPLADVKELRYARRVGATDLASLVLTNSHAAGFALDLPHVYYYVIPLGMAECYHALGDYARAETYYFEAAGYQFLNAVIEAPYIWLRLVTLYLDWGNSLYRNDQAADALPVYSNVLTPDTAEPATSLYTLAALKPGADAARIVIAALAGNQDVTALAVNPELSAAILDVHQELLKIKGGLDFFGHTTSFVPIWTFDYLQSVAINFAQLAMSAERDFIEFQRSGDLGTLTRQQLAQSAAQAAAEATTADYGVAIASSEDLAFSEGAQLADQRSTDTAALAAEYRNNSGIIAMDQAVAAIQSGTDDDVVNLQSAVSAMSSQFQQDSLDNQSSELSIAANQAKFEAGAADLRFQAAKAARDAAVLRAQSAQQIVQSFDDQFFTPDVWYQMANRVLRLYRRYLTMALRAARMMQQAYNFETDQSLKVIKVDYSTNEVNGLLGADTLMADIQSFTYDLITSKAGKPQPIKQTISLAQRHSFAFESSFRKTGIMEFETSIDDFDYYYPGTYAGRIEAVEVEVVGIVPVTGVSGTLTNSGISGYRRPSPAAGAAPEGELKYRIQSKETLVLSDYAPRQDSLFIQNDQRMLRLFQGAGVASTWRLELPKAVNDFDLDTLTDVRLTLYYKARYDPDLHTSVVASLNARPGLHAQQRGMPLRWLYPDAFFHFQDTGQLAITLRPRDFRRNETLPVLTSIGLVVSTNGSVPASGVSVALSSPTHAAISAQADASGSILSDVAGSPWQPLAGGTALGEYQLTVVAADNPALVKNGNLDLSPIVNLGLILGYSYTPPA